MTWISEWRDALRRVLLFVFSNIWDDTEVIPPISDPLSEFDIGRCSVAFATARRVSACHAEVFDVGGLNVC